MSYETGEDTVDTTAATSNTLQKGWAAFEEVMAPIKAPFERAIAQILAGFAASAKPSEAPLMTDETPFTTSKGYGADLKDFF